MRILPNIVLKSVIKYRILSYKKFLTGSNKLTMCVQNVNYEKKEKKY